MFQICLVALMAVAASARPQNELPLDANGDPFDVSKVPPQSRAKSFS